MKQMKKFLVTLLVIASLVLVDTKAIFANESVDKSTDYKISDTLYFKDSEVKIDNLYVTQTARTITFVNENEKKEAVEITIPEGIAVDTTQQNEGSDVIIDYNKETKKVTLTYGPASQSDVLINVFAENNEVSILPTPLQAISTDKDGLKIASNEVTVSVGNTPEEIKPEPTADEAPVEDAANDGQTRAAFPAPPTSNVNVETYFNVPKMATSSNAAFVNQEYPQSVTITREQSNRFGVMWAKNLIDLNFDFELDSYVYMNNTQGKNGDGMAFVLQNDKDGVNAHGAPGSGLGVYTGKAGEASKITNALAFEMDTWYNGDATEVFVDKYMGGKTNDTSPSYNGHIAAVETNRDVIPNTGQYGSNGAQFPIVQHNKVIYGTDSNKLTKNEWQPMNIKWDAQTKTFQYKFGNFETLSYTVDDLQKTFGGNMVRFGFTGSTGLAMQYNAVAFNKLPVSPVTVRYLEEGTNAELAPEVTISGEYDTEWKSEQKEFPGYKFTRVEGKTSGRLSDESSVTTYYYKKGEPKVSMSKTVDKENAKVGDTLTYTITAKNEGSSEWSGNIKDALNPEFVSVVPITTTINNVTVADASVWKNNEFLTNTTLAIGETKTITFKVTILPGAAGKDITNTVVSDDATVTITPPTITHLPKLDISKSVDKTSAKVGETITYTLEAKNSGTGAWEGTIIDELASGDLEKISSSTLVNGTSIKDDAAWSGNTLNLKQTVKPGETVKIEFKATIQKSAEGKEISNVAKTDDTQVTPTPPVVTSVAKVKLTKVADKAVAKVGETVTYTIEANNSGKGDWTGAISDKIQTSNVSVVPGTTMVNGSLVKDESIWTQDVLKYDANVKGNSKVTITFQVKLLKAAEGKVVTNIAETDDTNVTPTAPSEVKVPKLSLTKKADKEVAKVGETITYTIDANNTGLGEWKGAIIDALQTENVELVAGSTKVNGKSVEEKSIWNKGTLTLETTVAANTKTTITFQVKLLKAAEGKEVTNIAKTNDENVTPTTPTVTKAPKLSLTKKADKEVAKVGETITYTIEANNTGLGEWKGSIIDALKTENVALVAGSTTVNGKAVEEGKIWNNGKLTLETSVAANSKTTITFQVKLLKAAEGKEITNIAETDDKNVTPTTPVVTKAPKLELSKTVDKASAKVGEVLTYTIEANNSGLGLWNGIIQDTLNGKHVALVAGSTRVDGQPVADDLVWNGQEMKYEASVKAGSTTSITFQVTVLKDAGNQTIENVAMSDDINVKPTAPATTKVIVETLPSTGMSDTAWTYGYSLILVGFGALFLNERRKAKAL